MGILKGYRTYIAAGLAILTAAAGYLTGELDLMAALTAAFNAAALAYLRASEK